MKKRALSLLLALVTLFSLSVPAFAEEEPVTTAEEPVVTEEPVEAAEVVETEEEPVEEPEEVEEATEEAPAEPETAASGSCGDNVLWSFADGTLTISGTGAMKDYNGYYNTPWEYLHDQIKIVIIQPGVTSIGESAFEDCESLTSVTIPDSVTGIGESAFEGCDVLTSVMIPDSVTSIGKWAFYYCWSLTSVTIPSGVTSIEEWTFKNCLSLQSVTISDGVTSIGESAFTDCSALTSVTIPATVTSIEMWAFSSCDSLTNVTIPASVISIGTEAFRDCARLTTVTILSSSTIIGERAFSGTPWSAAQGDFFVVNGILQEYRGFDEIVTIPSGVTSIGGQAFYNNNRLTSVTIPEGVVSIGEEAFAACFNLTSVTLPKSLTSIERGAFDSCQKLTSVTIPENVIRVGSGAFSGCNALKKVVVPGSLSSIESDTFFWCENLTDVTIQEGIKTIGEGAFAGTALVNVTVPASVTEIGTGAFLCNRPVNIRILNDSCTIAGLGPYGDQSKGENLQTAFSQSSVIYGYRGSTAEAYASQYNYDFKTVEEWNPAPTATPKPTSTPEPTTKPTATPKPTNTPKPGTTPAPTAVPTFAVPKVKIEKVSAGIKVSWNKIDGAPRYMVYYKEGNGSWKQIGTTTATSYTRKTADLKNGVKYTFTVRCCANDKKTMLSGYKASNSITHTVDLAAPTVKISKVSNGIKVSWNKVASSPRYMVYYKEGNGSWKKIGTTTSTTYTRKAANLKNGTTYAFTVRCCANDKKTLLSGYKASNSLQFIVTLVAPTVKIAKVSNGIKVTWNKITGSPRYMVYYKEGSGSWKKIGTTTATAYTRAAKYLKNNVTYSFTVRCCANDKKTLLSTYKASSGLKYKK